MVRPTRPNELTATEAAALGPRTLTAALDDAAADPDGLAIVDGPHRLTHGDHRRLVEAVATGLRDRGMQPGDVVTVELPNWWETIVAMGAVLRMGAVVNPVTPIYRDREVSFILAQSRAKVIVIPHRFRNYDFVEMAQRILPSLDDPPLVVVARPEGELPPGFVDFASLLERHEPQPDAATATEVALLLYTSGTTAAPKGVLHTHQTLEYENRSIIELFGLGAGDAVFMPSPLTHITGFLYGVLMPPMLPAPVVLQDVWEPAAGRDVIEREQCRFSLAATPFLQGLTDQYASARTSSALRYFACGGADVPPELVRRAGQVLDATVVRVYGSSEFPTFSCGSPDDSEHVAADTDGPPIGPVAWRLDEPDDSGVGELLVRGPELFVGYLDAALNDDAFTADGYFRTGDLASIDDGAIVIRGRKKDVIIRGGENISVKEVEDLLYACPAIVDVAIVGMPDPVLGERACAFVVPAPGATIDLGTVTEFLDSKRIARQKYPERVEIIGELPRTATGKVQKFALRDRAAAVSP